MNKTFEISIHALREEGDAIDLLPNLTPEQFLSTPSARRATTCSVASTTRASYFYPRPPRGGRRTSTVSGTLPGAYFYPRPPRGGRRNRPAAQPDPGTISIHALREEGDDLQRGFDNQSVIFLSTPSARRATDFNGKWHFTRGIFLSTPSARRATNLQPWAGMVKSISIHALREEGDSKRGSKITPSLYFYPRPPRGGRPMTIAVMERGC